MTDCSVFNETQVNLVWWPLRREQDDVSPKTESADVALLALGVQAELVTKEQGWCASACAEDVRRAVGTSAGRNIFKVG